MFDKVWKEIKYEAMTNYINSIKSRVSITKDIPYWKDQPNKTKAETYHDYSGKLLNKIADELGERVSEEHTVLIVPVLFLTVLLFSPVEHPEVDESFGSGPSLIGVLCHSATIIIDPTLHNEFYAYNLTNPTKVLKLEIKE